MLTHRSVTELYNIGYPTETHFKPKSRETLFVYNLLRSYRIVLKFYTEHGSDIAILCAKFQSDSTTETDVIDKRDFARV